MISSSGNLNATCADVSELNDMEQDESTVFNSHSSRKSLHIKDKVCEGYYADTQSIYLNFPFQVFDLFPEKINFVFCNNKFHSKICADNYYILIENSSNQVNQACNNLRYDNFLQGK